MCCAGPCPVGGCAKAPADYPSKPVTIIIGFTPGGPVDLEYRVFANQISANTGRTFLLDFKPGAGGLVGTAHVAKAPPDGYTILGTTNSFTTLPALHQSMPYDAQEDLAPASLLAKRLSLLIVHPSLPVNSLAEYIDYAQANPGKINFGTPGVAGGPHLASEWLHSVIDTRVTYVHYKGARARGGRPAGGPGGRLAVGAGGGDGGGTPAPIVTRLNAEFIKALKTPGIARKMEGEGNMFVGSTPEQLREVVAREIAQFRRIVKESNIQSPTD